MFVGVGEAEVDQLEGAVEINEQILGLEVPVDDAELVQVLDAGDELPEELAGLMLLQPFLFYDHLEELPLGHVLHHQEELLWSLNYLVQLNDVWVPDLLQNVDFSSDPLDIGHVGDPTLLKHLHSHSLTSDRVDPQLHLPKRALAQISSHHVVPDGPTALKSRLGLVPHQ